MNAPVESIKDRQFGRLTAICLYKKDPRQGQIWLCRCECKREKIARRSSLVAGYVLSCGCLQKEIARENMRQAGSRNGKALKGSNTVPISLDTAIHSWFSYQGELYPVSCCDPQILHAAIRCALKGRKLSEDGEVILYQDLLDEEDRWWLLLCLEEKGRLFPLYRGREEAKKAS
jgi:hypothetical protein